MAHFETMTKIAFGSVPASYNGSADIAAPTVLGPFHLLIDSTLDQPVYLSFDGTNDHIYLAATTASKTFLCHDRVGFNFGQRIWVKRVSGAPTAGNLMVTFVSPSK